MVSLREAQREPGLEPSSLVVTSQLPVRLWSPLLDFPPSHLAPPALLLSVPVTQPSPVVRGVFSNLQVSCLPQWLRACPPTVGGVSLIPGWGTKIPHATQCGQKKKKIGRLLPPWLPQDRPDRPGKPGMREHRG